MLEVKLPVESMYGLLDLSKALDFNLISRAKKIVISTEQSKLTDFKGPFTFFSEITFPPHDLIWVACQKSRSACQKSIFWPARNWDRPATNRYWPARNHDRPAANQYWISISGRPILICSRQISISSRLESRFLAGQSRFLAGRSRFAAGQNLNLWLADLDFRIAGKQEKWC